MSKRFALDPQDRELFRTTIGTVQRLYCDRVDPQPTHPAPQRRLVAAPDRQVIPDLFSDYFEARALEDGEELCYRRPGVQQATLRKLRRGYFAVGAVLDLHGLRAAEAREQLARFLYQASVQGQNCVCIIHGKGKGSRQRGAVLKGKVNTWLQQCVEVLAFCPAQPPHGGNGAVYVLLRNA